MARTLVLVVAALACLVTSFQATSLSVPDQPHNENEAFDIPSQEFPQLESKALRGSGESAYRLSQYHFFITLNESEAWRWLLIAAEDGNPTAEYSLASRLSEHENPQDKLRACFWLTRVKGQGDRQLKELTSELSWELREVCKSH